MNSQALIWTAFLGFSSAGKVSISLAPRFGLAGVGSVTGRLWCRSDHEPFGLLRSLTQAWWPQRTYSAAQQRPDLSGLTAYLILREHMCHWESISTHVISILLREYLAGRYSCHYQQSWSGPMIGKAGRKRFQEESTGGSRLLPKRESVKLN